MSPRADLALYGHDGRLVAMVEVRNKRGTSPQWAAQLRHNLLAHGGGRRADFFILITPDRIYVWNSSAGEAAVEPTLVVDPTPLFGAYFDRVKVVPDQMSGHAFELMVGALLGDLMHPARQVSTPARAVQELESSGLLGAIRDGRVEYEAAA